MRSIPGKIAFSLKIGVKYFLRTKSLHQIKMRLSNVKTFCMFLNYSILKLISASSFGNL